MILCDTGVLVAAALPRDSDHHVCVELLTGLRLAGRRLLLPPTVIAETGYMIQSFGSADLEAEFLESVANGDFEPIEFVAGDYGRIAELARQYASFPLGVTDASVLALTEKLGLTEVATLDHRHFPNVRLRHTDYLTLLP